ncbi:MAG: bacterioferritin-associated ferredoxin [Oscillospiraceae bacterium]|nr:(2Fe-2S)-binding protein [Oscillospiraceae bacterium]
MENIEICHCMGVSVNDIDVALHKGENLTDVTQAFKKVQEQTSCSTGCGGCYDKIIETISDLMHR